MTSSPHRPPPPAGASAEPGVLLRSAARLGAVVVTVFAGAVVFALLAGLLGGPALRAAAGAVDLDLPDSSGLPDLAERSVVYAADGSVLAVLHEEVDRRVVELDDIPDHVRYAVLTAEDRKFYEHGGYDVEGIGRAMVANLRAGGIEQGGSTITQQLAKQNFVGGAQTFERKISELLHAVALEEEFSKDELLTRYLNQVYFGSGAYGIAAAAEEFFDVRPEDLTPAQSALLAGLIRAPGSLDPRRNPEEALRRRDAVLADMAALGYLQRDAAEALAAEPLDVTPERERDVREPYFVEAVKREFFANPEFGDTRDDRIDLLFSGGLEIHTTLDPDLQEIADEVVADHFPDEDGPTAAIAAVDPRTGRVIALHSGADFREESYDLAMQGRRQPGSAFKPFLLAAALEAGFPLELTLDGNGPLRLDIPGHVEPWTVDNYEGSSHGRIDLRDALVRSVNTAFAQLVLLLGPEDAADLAARMGINMEAATAGNIVPSIALGGFERGVTALEMASAYGTFADGGAHVRPHVIDRVVDRGGREIFTTEPEREEVLDEAVNAVMVDVMQDVVRRGTGTRAQLPDWQPAGKTGTTQRNADAWFVGFVPVMSTAVWSGHAQGQVSVPGMTGGSVPAAVWHDFMERALADVDPVDFPDVDLDLSHVLAGEPVDVPDVRGMEEAEALDVLAEHRLVATVRVVASHAPEGEVAWQDPRPGEEATPGDRVTLGVSSGRPPAPEPEPEPQPAPAPEPAPEPEPQPAPQPEPEPEPQRHRAPTRPEPEPEPAPAPEPAPEPEPEPAPAPEPEPEPAPEPAPVPAPAPAPDPGGGGAPGPRPGAPEDGLPIPGG